MGLFKSLTGTTIQASDPFLDAVVSYQSTESDAPYTSTKALKNSDVFTAVKIIASDIASNDIQMIEDSNSKEHEYLTLLNERPNKLMDGISSLL